MFQKQSFDLHVGKNGITHEIIAQLHKTIERFFLTHSRAALSSIFFNGASFLCVLGGAGKKVLHYVVEKGRK